MDIWKPTYDELESYYNDNFSLSGLDTDISNKFALISLICYLTAELRKNNPDVTCYKTIMAIVKKDNVNDQYFKFLRGLSVVCSDMMKHTKDYMTFDLKSSKDIINKVHEILNTWLPF